MQEIDYILKENGRALQDFLSLPQSVCSMSTNYQNDLILHELRYDRTEQASEAANLVSMLNSEQEMIYKEIKSLSKYSPGRLLTKREK